ncbi:MAG: mannonate dehydratase [Bacteroidales bacterium]|nr:mannonate dehydratase [Bacteroidales bacterium]
MEKTWRWFGKNDKISLQMLRQIGVEGIVTALHQIKNGDIWTYEDIMDLKTYIERAGLRWSVVESLPVMESIKYGGPDRDELIEKYIISLENLGRAGVKTVCYNFMPVIDWVRTDLEHPWPDGTSSLYFNRTEFAYFEIYILEREGARDSYSPAELARVDAMHKTATDEFRQQLVENIIIKTQGFVNGNISEEDNNPVKKFKDLLALYKGIDRDTLRNNMKYWLEKIMPTCDKWGINMCVHPDDPPFQLLGLPRIVTCAEDIRWFLNAVPNVHNGLTFCAGSLSAGLHNDVPAMAREFIDRIHFIHLRSTMATPDGNFIEALHTGGRANVADLVCFFEENAKADVPMRVDHGRMMLGDEDKGYNAGYSFHGRMYALAQVDGMMAMVRQGHTTDHK